MRYHFSGREDIEAAFWEEVEENDASGSDEAGRAEPPSARFVDDEEQARRIVRETAARIRSKYPLS